VRRGALAAVILAAMLVPAEADSAGVYENAATESAFLLAPQQVVLRASVEISRDSLDAAIYRVYAAFPVRNTFLVALEQPLVSVSGPSDVDASLGDLMMRVRARVAGHTRVLWATGMLSAGTGEMRLFPYSSESVDIGLGVAATDSIGALDVYAAAGYVWAQRIPDELKQQHDNYARFSGGANLRLGANAAVRAGFLTEQYASLDARRDLFYAGAGWRWTDALRFFLEGQIETGPVGERVSDWAAASGVAVHF